MGDLSGSESSCTSCFLCLCLVAQLCPILCDPIVYSLPDPSVPRDSPGKNTGVGCHALLQEIFPTQGLNPRLPHCRHILYHLSHQGNPASSVQFSSVQLLSHVQLSATPWTAARQASLSITNSQSLLKLMSIESVMPSNCQASVCSSVLCLVTAKIWSDGH